MNFRLPGQYAFASAVGGPSTTAGGLTENWNRVYDSITGRYLEPDPMGQQADYSAYRYVVARPLRDSDRMGLFTTDYSGLSSCQQKQKCKNGDNFQSNWAQGWVQAYMNAQKQPCQDAFKDINSSLDILSILQESESGWPTVHLGQGE